MNRPQDLQTPPPPPYPPTPNPPLAAKGFSLQPNQRSKTTRLTLFWLCLLALKTLDNLNVQYKTDSFDFHMNPNTEPHTIFFVLFCIFFTFNWRYKWNRKDYGYAIHLIDHFKTDYTCRNGHFQGKTGSRKKKIKKKKKQGPIQVSFIEVTSNLRVEVSMPLGNTKEANPFKRDSLNHIPTHFVIRLDSKSILKLGPLDSSNPRFSSLNIPAHMNHSESWLLEGISCPALSLFLSVWLLCWKLGRNPPSFDLDPEGEREESSA